MVSTQTIQYVRLQKRGLPRRECSLPRALQLDQFRVLICGSNGSESVRAAVELKAAERKRRDGIPCSSCQYYSRAAVVVAG